MEDSIEEDMAKVNTYIELVSEKDYCNCNELNTILGKHCDGSKNVAYAMQHILSEYKKVLKENEELNEKILDNAGIYQLGFKDGEESYIKKVKDKIEELKEKIENLPAEVYPIIEDDLQIKIEVLEELLESEE